MHDGLIKHRTLSGELRKSLNTNENRPSNRFFNVTSILSRTVLSDR